ncbi:oligosaccharide flippase family protein [Adhaeribacter aerolatus]|uniref:oligosaccharide flippase family protein n=1 Tax=Adhaeribacter aerolatus TaxID=670289 RepID=UPI0011BEC471|nr:oligosaccharide flippase family protein [Adhaeribacter aerolatus]
MLGTATNKINAFKSSPLFKNSFWGILSNIVQNVFLTLFFVILARKLGTDEFAHYLIANALYLLLAAFSTLGLSQWFIRELDDTADEKELINRFFKVQLLFGIAFFFFNAGTALVLYSDFNIRVYTIFFGLNIIVDNLIYAIKALNIAKHEQKITFKILIIEALLLFALAGTLYLFKVSVLFLIVAQIFIRLFSLNLFLRLGTSKLVSISTILKSEISYKDVKALIINNWVFVIIGSISLIYWRSANIIVSKFLSLTDVAIYAITYKVFSVFIIFPLIVSNSVYPALVKLFNKGDVEKLKEFYQNVFLFYFLYGLLAFSFIFSFSDILLPFIFSKTYESTAFYTREMFLTMLVFPTAILQANLLVAIKLERFDMWINAASLAIYIILTMIGLAFHQSLTGIYLSIFISFLVFHFIQDLVLINRKILTKGHMAFFYIISITCTLAYVELIQFFNPYLFFVLFWVIVGTLFLLFFLRTQKKHSIQPTVAKNLEDS